MEIRSVFPGLVLIGAGSAGSVLLGSAVSLSLIGLLGLLLLVVPVLCSLWYLNARILQLEDLTQNSSRQVRRAVEVHATTMAHRYDITMEQMVDLNNELLRRVYR